MKKWTKEEVDFAIEEIKNGKTYEEISILLDRTYKSVRVKLIKIGKGRKIFIDTIIKDNVHICLNCGNEFTNIDKRRKFCSGKCSAIYNNKLRNKKEISYCVHCGNELNNRQKNYCSIDCQTEYNRNIKIQKWLNGEIEGRRGENGTAIWIKSYLIKERGEKCEECGWDKVNPTSNNIPIELEHIDGDHTNNKIENLKLLCPSCHSLTPTYKGANAGKGRHNRRKRYKEGKSY